MVNNVGLINVYKTLFFLIVSRIREKYVVKPPKMPKTTLFLSMNLVQVKRGRYRILS